MCKYTCMRVNEVRTPFGVAPQKLSIFFVFCFVSFWESLGPVRLGQQTCMLQGSSCLYSQHGVSTLVQSLPTFYMASGDQIQGSHLHSQHSTHGAFSRLQLVELGPDAGLKSWNQVARGQTSSVSAFVVPKVLIQHRNLSARPHLAMLRGNLKLAIV